MSKTVLTFQITLEGKEEINPIKEALIRQINYLGSTMYANDTKEKMGLGFLKSIVEQLNLVDADDSQFKKEPK